MLVRQLRSLRPASLLLGFGLLAYAGCSSGGTTAVAVTHPTMIEVAPEDFLGEVPCSEGPGLKRFVATLIDTDYVAQGGASAVDATADAEAGGAADFQLPSSRPTPCLAAVGFGLVVSGRHYDVEIDGYDTEDLAPRASGSRQMVSTVAAPGRPEASLLTPRWSARCDDTIAVDSTIVRALHCTPFQPLDDTAPGSVRIPLARLMGGLVCGDQPGQISHFEVTLSSGDGVMHVRSVPCTADAELSYDELSPRDRVTAYVTAFSADSTDAFAGATCDALTSPAATVDAECTGLSQVGTLRIDLKAALASVALSCNTRSISAVTIDVPGVAQSERMLPPDCLQPFEHGFAPGPAAVSVTVQPADSSAAAVSLVCAAEIAPGQLALADCTQNSP
jgi:hypothetical protein